LLRLLLGHLPAPTYRFRKAIKQLDELIYGIIDERRASGKDTGDLPERLGWHLWPTYTAHTIWWLSHHLVATSLYTHGIGHLAYTKIRHLAYTKIRHLAYAVGRAL
jgi:hypothetical protein